MTFLELFRKGKFGLHKLWLSQVPTKNELVRQFLLNQFPKEVDQFDFNRDGKLADLDYYLKPLIEISKNVRQVLYINNFNVNQEQLVRLFEANKDKEYFGFGWCKLALDSPPDFRNCLEGSKIKRLALGV